MYERSKVILKVILIIVLFFAASFVLKVFENANAQTHGFEYTAVVLKYGIEFIVGIIIGSIAKNIAGYRSRKEPFSGTCLALTLVFVLIALLPLTGILFEELPPLLENVFMYSETAMLIAGYFFVNTFNKES